MLTKQYPFTGKGIPELQNNLLNNPPNLELLADEKYEKLRDFLLKIFEKDPDNRINIYEMLDHPWVTRDGQSVIDLDLDTLTSEDMSQGIDPYTGSHSMQSGIPAQL